MDCFWLQKQRTDNRLNNIVGHLRGILERPNAFALKERRIHLASGVFSLTGEGTLLQFSPELISRNRSPIALDEKARCDRSLNELVYPAVRPDDIRLLQKYAGMCLLGTNLIQRMLILNGESGRGKTQLANVLQAIIGRENVTQLRTKFLGDRFETFRFLKKTLLIGVDVESNFLSTSGGMVYALSVASNICLEALRIFAEIVKHSAQRAQASATEFAGASRCQFRDGKKMIS